jgi:pilus assembly protein CpaF
MVLMAGMDLPVTAIREQIASAVDIIVQQSRFACGSRRITSVVEVTGVESGKIQLQEVFAFVQTGVQNGKTAGFFTGRDSVPEFYEELAAIGVPLDREIFAAAAAPAGVAATKH